LPNREERRVNYKEKKKALRPLGVDQMKPPTQSPLLRRGKREGEMYTSAKGGKKVQRTRVAAGSGKVWPAWHAQKKTGQVDTRWEEKSRPRPKTPGAVKKKEKKKKKKERGALKSHRKMRLMGGRNRESVNSANKRD